MKHPTDKNDLEKSFIGNNEKKRMKSFLFQRYENELDRQQYGIKRWSVYRFT